MRTRATSLIAVCAASAALAPPASAAFAPALAVGLDPATAGAPAALTATISQPALDTAVERATLTLPKGFKTLSAPDATACPLASVRLAACPDSSRVGSVEGLVGAAIGLSGSIHKFSKGSFVLLVSGLGGSLKQTVPGGIVKRDNGALDLTLDELPALALSSLTLRFDGGGRSFVQTPAECGTYPIDGKFTSRHDELALARATTEITGCAGVPAVGVTSLRMSRKQFRPGRRSIIAWSAGRATDHTNVRIERKRGRKGWKVVGVLVSTGHAGENVLRWDGRIDGRKLRPGRYGVRIQPAGSAPSKLLRFKIRRP